TLSSSHILRIGVALLGVRVTFGDIASLGAPTVLLVLSGVAAAILGGCAIGRAFGLKSDHAVLSAGAVAICGASAALAISAALPNHKSIERNTILTVVGVTALSTIAMVAYPMIARLLDLNDVEAGVFLGATIHDVAQVVGAGYMISDSAGETATIVKLMRVACLAPVILLVGFLFRTRSCSDDAPTLAPAFLIGFVTLVILNSFGVVPAGLNETLTVISRYALVCAVAALGVKTSLKDIVAVGPTPVLVLSLQTGLLAAFSLIGLTLFLSL
ncbi:MAG: putative sulfate exporter family transporter, partial [Pseudomonadota bacterium]